jgi:L-alanine-DL-glutamate epimerase-like enolase superfamily enzyme
MPPRATGTKVDVATHAFELVEPFAIARGTIHAIEVVTLTLEHGGRRGRGECRPYARYGESIASVRAQIEAIVPALEGGLARLELSQRLPAGAARNAVDAALLDLEARIANRRAHEILDLPPPRAVATARTISIASPATMADRARALSRDAGDRTPVLKLKLAGALGIDLERVAAVRDAAPHAVIVVDANEGFAARDVVALLAGLATLGIALVEQPLRAGGDAMLATIERPLPVFADESHHEAADVAALADRYDGINVKLDKAGGPTHALAAIRAARAADLEVMIGCMVCSSLAIAPALLLAGLCDFADVDGPLWLASDVRSAPAFAAGAIEPPSPELWG